MQAEPVSRETLQGLLDLLMAEEDNVRRSQNPRLNLEAIIVRICYLEPMVSVEEILSRMEDLEKRLSTGPPASPPPDAPAPRDVDRRRCNASFATVIADEPLPSSPVAAQDEHVETGSNPATQGERNGESEASCSSIREGRDSGQLWEAYKDFVKKKSHPLWSKIEPGRMIGYESGQLRIGFPKGYVFLENISETSQKERIAEIARDFFHEDVRVTIETLAPGPENGAADRTNGDRNGILRDIKRQALNEPLLQKVFDIFEGAEVREVIARKKA
jgi:DNA polymerase-3 subunit gamma/tau